MTEGPAGLGYVPHMERLHEWDNVGYGRVPEGCGCLDELRIVFLPMKARSSHRVAMPTKRRDARGWEIPGKRAGSVPRDLKICQAVNHPWTIVLSYHTSILYSYLRSKVDFVETPCAYAYSHHFIPPVLFHE